MFTGIVEAIGTVMELVHSGTNLDIIMEVSFAGELKVDQSVSHNGACLTVVNIEGNKYTVTAIKETLEKTNLGLLKIGDAVNLERSMLMNGRIDGHIVQGHVDQTAVCKSVINNNGSWLFTFEFEPAEAGGAFTVEKGSVCVNGVSLTVVNSGINTFSVAIIPYTFGHTNFSTLSEGSLVNLEFDIIGKYVAKYTSLYK